MVGSKARALDDIQLQAVCAVRRIRASACPLGGNGVESMSAKNTAKGVVSVIAILLAGLLWHVVFPVWFGARERIARGLLRLGRWVEP